VEKLVAGIDLGGTKIQAVVLDRERVLGSARAATPQEGADSVMAAVVEAVKTALHNAEASGSALAAVGIGTPGTIDLRGGVANAPNLPGFEKPEPVPLAAGLSKRFGGIKVKVDNDVRVAVLGEWRRGAGRPFTDFLGVFVGTGVGGGLVLDGKIRHGLGAAGEIGHTTVKPGGRKCGCGRDGHLEAYAGRRMIEATARRWQGDGRKTKLFQIMKDKGRDRLTSGVIAKALNKHDAVAQELVDQAVWALGVALSNAQNLLDVEAIIVGGGLGDRLGKPFIDRVAEAAQPLLLVPERPPQFLPTQLGDLSGAVGAAVLAAP